MARPGPFEQIYNLPVGGEAITRPIPGEPIDKALQRIKVRLAKYAADNRHFRVKIHGDVIRVQRTCKGHNTKIGDWLIMRAGDRLLLKTCPTPADIKKARSSCDYMQSRWCKKFGHLPFAERQLAMKRFPSGSWLIIPDRQERLVVECWADVDGNRINATSGDAAPLRTLWAGEWP